MRRFQMLIAGAAAMCGLLVSEPGLAAEPPGIGGASKKHDVIMDSAYSAVLRTEKDADSAPGPNSVSNPGSLSGLWYNPAQDGHGLSLIFSDQTVAVAWYVYDLSGRQLYLVGAAQVVNGIATVPLVSTGTGWFPSNLPSGVPWPRPQNISWGTVSINILSCTSIRASWSPSVAGFTAGSVDLVPIIRAAGLTCQSSSGQGDDHGNTCATATNYDTAGARGAIDPSTDRDVFRFTITQQSRLSAGTLLDGPSSLNPYGRLLDTNCNVIRENDDDPTGVTGPNFAFRDVPLSPGTYFIEVSSSQGSSRGAYGLGINPTPVSAPNMTLSLVNRLVYPLRFFANGTLLATVSGQSSQSVQLPAPSSLSVNFEMQRPATSSGVAIGEEISGSFSAITNPSGTVTFRVTNVFSDRSIFVPYISNGSGSTLLMGTNMGLQSENRCNCTVPSGASNVGLGYYRLFSNSNVRAYRAGSNYSSPYLYWGVDVSGTTTPLTNLAQPETGIVPLSTSVAP